MHKFDGESVKRSHERVPSMLTAEQRTGRSAQNPSSVVRTYRHAGKPNAAGRHSDGRLDRLLARVHAIAELAVYDLGRSGFVGGKKRRWHKEQIHRTTGKPGHWSIDIWEIGWTDAKRKSLKKKPKRNRALESLNQISRATNAYPGTVRKIAVLCARQILVDLGYRDGIWDEDDLGGIVLAVTGVA